MSKHQHRCTWDCFFFFNLCQVLTQQKDSFYFLNYFKANIERSNRFYLDVESSGGGDDLKQVVSKQEVPEGTERTFLINLHVFNLPGK